MSDYPHEKFVLQAYNVLVIYFMVHRLEGMHNNFCNRSLQPIVLTCCSNACTLYKAQCTAENWTKLNSTELFSLDQFPAVHWTGDDLQRFGDEIGGRRRFFTIGAYSTVQSVLSWIGQSMQIGSFHFIIIIII